MAVILSVDGCVLDREALGDVPSARLLEVRFTQGERAACATATLQHECAPHELLAALRRWAGARGWLVTIAPVSARG